ncbi:MAG TPA: TonB-dependent receptor [Bryobacteraceae bacterium]|nr:TonB-dependent receptor [Bryobacteraceae bacterium]
MTHGTKSPSLCGKPAYWTRTAALGLLLASLGFAQEARVSGRITDNSGAVVPGVKVTITNTDTGISRDTKTNDLGYYTLPLLQPGNYKITAEKQGFRAKEETGIVLLVDQRANIDLTMEVGQLTQEISVTAAPPLLDTIEPSVGQVIENRQVVEMPLNGRNYITLGLLSAGTSDPIAGSRDQGFSAGGQRLSANNYLLDGADNNSYELADAGRMGGMVAPSIDAVQEFKVQTNSYSAEYGRGTGATINVTIKSGSNQIHGTAYEFLRNDLVDAKNFFASPTAAKPQYQRNQYGFAAGGPIIKNKTFIFGDWEGTNIRQAQSAVDTIPTVAERTGNFSQETKSLKNPSTGAVFPGNIIPPSLIDPLAAKLIALYPTPVNGNLSSNYLYDGPDDEDDRRWDIRVDHTFREKDSIYGRVSHYGVTIPGILNLPPPAFGANAFDETISGWNDSLGWNHIFTPSFMAITRVSWSYNEFSRVNPAVAGSANLNALYGIPGGDDSIPGGMSSFGITGYTQLGLGSNNPTIRNSQNRQVMSDLNWSHGAHNLKFGVNLLRLQNNIVNSNYDIGIWNFNGQFTGDGMADFLLGWSDQWESSIEEKVNVRGWLPAAYVQDDWKLSPKLTVNLGMRYEVGLPYYDTQNRLANFDLDNPASPHLILASGSGGYGAMSLVNVNTDGWEPRVGLAYQVTPRTVIRTGYGIYRTYFEPMGDTEFLTNNPPFAYTVTLASSQSAPAVVLQTGPPAGAVSLAHATGLTFASYPLSPHRAYAQQWNFNIQQQLAANWLLEVGYSGEKGVHLINRFDGNFAPPEPGNINANRPIQSAVIPPSGVVVSPLGGIYKYVFAGNSNYQAMVVKLEKPLTKGLTLLTSYTWSKTMGDVCSDSADGSSTNCGFQDPLNMRAEKSLDNQDMGQRFVTSVLYDIPVGHGRRFASQMPKALNGVAGGWTIGGIFTRRSGLPYTIVDSGNPANDGSLVIIDRPNLVGNPYSVPWSVGRAFNTSAFAVQPAYTYGSLGRNTMVMPDVTNLDLILSKIFTVTERVRLEGRFEVFNSTNTPPFTTAPNATVGTNGFGQTTAAGAPRQLQFALKALF